MKKNNYSISRSILDALKLSIIVSLIILFFNSVHVLCISISLAFLIYKIIKNKIKINFCLVFFFNLFNLLITYLFDELSFLSVFFSDGLFGGMEYAVHIYIYYHLSVVVLIISSLIRLFTWIIRKKI